MKIALYIEDGLEQIVLTPESKTEEGILGKLHDGSRELSILKGSFYDCRGGWKRHGAHVAHSAYGKSEENDTSTMIVLREPKAENGDQLGQVEMSVTSKVLPEPPEMRQAYLSALKEKSDNIKPGGITWVEPD